MAPRLSTLLCGAAAAFAAGGVAFVQPSAGSRPRVPEYGLAAEAAASQLPGSSAQESSSSVQGLLLGAALGLAVGLAGLATAPAYAALGPEPPRCDDVMVSVRETARTQGWNLIPHGITLRNGGDQDDSLKMIPRDPKTGAPEAKAYKQCVEWSKWKQAESHEVFEQFFNNARAMNHEEYGVRSTAADNFVRQSGKFPFNIHVGKNYNEDGTVKFQPWTGSSASEKAKMREIRLEQEAQRRKGVFSYLNHFPGPPVAATYNPVADVGK